MGLRCLIGHDYSEPQIERDRDEQGDEVVVTIEEFRECSRCGHRRTVSENKEITTLSPPDADPDDGAVAGDEGAAGDAPDDRPADTYDDVSAEEDDGVILEKEPAAEPERGHGEWPAADVNRAAATTGDATGSTPTHPDATAVAAGAASTAIGNGSTSDNGGPTAAGGHDLPETAADTDATPADAAGAWPAVSEDADEGFDAEPTDGMPATDAFEDDYSTDTRSDPAGSPTEELVDPAAPGRGSAASGIESETPGPTPGRQQRPAGDTEFVCPACDHRQSATGSSLRPGDICPECRSGYLSEREQ